MGNFSRKPLRGTKQGSEKINLRRNSRLGPRVPGVRPACASARRLASRKLIMIVALGSSSTAGAGASSAETTYPSRLMVELAQRFQTQPIMVLNRGISGERAVGMLARLEEGGSAERPARG